MRTIAFILLAISLGCGVALGQRNRAADVNPQPPYGSSDTNNSPATYAAPAYGVAMPGPDGQICVTTPKLMGKPQYGTSTTCYRDGLQVPSTDASALPNPMDATGVPADQDRGDEPQD
jgi:hypothetical protein